MKRLLSKTKKRLPLIIYFVFWGLFFTVLWSNQLQIKPNGWYSAGTETWGDGAAHLTYMSIFAFRDEWPTEHPLFLGTPLSYPFASDMIGGLLTKAGMPLFLAYSLWGLILSFLLLTMIFLFFYLLFKNYWLALISSNLLLWSGGLGGLLFFEDVSQQGLWQTLTQLPREYTHIDEEGIFWINTISANFLPQRALLLGMPIGIMILISWWNTIQNKTKKWLLVLAGSLTGLLPIIHTHTAIVLAFVFTWILIYDTYLHRKFRVDWFWFMIPAALVGVPMVIRLLTLVETSFFSYKPGWLSHVKNDNFLWFWFKNWGVFSIVGLLGLWLTPKKVRLFLLPALGLWIIANLFLFQPWDWDNSKIFLWVYFLLSGSAGYLLWLLWKKNLSFKFLSVLLFVLMTFSGMLDTLRLLQWEHTAVHMFSFEDVALAEEVRVKTEPEALFLTGDGHTHWVPTLTGRQILMGFKGWLWSYGIDYHERDRDVRVMFAGGQAGLRLLSKYGVDYVVIGPHELSEFKANEVFYKQNFPIIIQNSSTRVYKITL